MKKTIYGLYVMTFLIFLTGCGKENVKQHTDKTKNSSGKLIKKTSMGYEQYSKSEVFPDIKKIITRGTLNVGIYQGGDIPFLIKDTEGKIIDGLDIEISTSLARHLGVKAVFDNNIANQTELFKKLHTGEIDIAVGELSHTFDRSKYVYFSNTYARLRQSLIVCKKEAIELNIRENPYKYMCKNAFKIGVHESAYAEFADTLFPKAQIYEYPTLKEALNALTNHEILAVLGDENEITLLSRKHPEIALTATAYVLKYQNDNIAIGISPKNPNLFDYINLYLESHDFCFNVDDLIEKYPEAYKCE